MKNASSDYHPEDKILRSVFPCPQGNHRCWHGRTGQSPWLDGRCIEAHEKWLQTFQAEEEIPTADHSPKRRTSGWIRLLAPSSSPPPVVLGTKQSREIWQKIHSTQMSPLFWTLWNCLFQQRDYSRGEKKTQTKPPNHPAWLSYSELIQLLCCTFLVTSQCNFSHSMQAELTEMNSNSDFSALTSVIFNRYRFLPFPYELLAWDGVPGKNKGVLEIIWDTAPPCQAQQGGNLSWSMKMLTENFHVRTHIDDSED